MPYSTIAINGFRGGGIALNGLSHQAHASSSKPTQIAICGMGSGLAVSGFAAKKIPATKTGFQVITLSAFGDTFHKTAYGDTYSSGGGVG